MGIRCYLNEDGKKQYMCVCDECGTIYGWNRPTVEKLKIFAEETHGWQITLNVSKSHLVMCPKCKEDKNIINYLS
jgi:Fe2+ or Zn2+ uptake regulation protein